MRNLRSALGVLPEVPPQLDSVPFSLQTLRKMSCRNGHEDQYHFGSPADSERPVALRPPLARGLPFRLRLLLRSQR
jgi:hypothetical protein